MEDNQLKSLSKIRAGEAVKPARVAANISGCIFLKAQFSVLKFFG